MVAITHFVDFVHLQNEHSAYDPDQEIYDTDLPDDALSDLNPMEKRKEEEKKKLMELKQKKFFLMDDKYLNLNTNPYNQKIRDELSSYIPLLQYDSTMIKDWIKSVHFHLGINDIIDDYFPDFLNGYMFLNIIRYPYQVTKRNLDESGCYQWPDQFFNAIWIAAKDFHTKYLLELGIAKVGESCGQINALKIESHMLSRVLQENDIMYDRKMGGQCVQDELIGPRLHDMIVKEDAKHPRWTEEHQNELDSMYKLLSGKLESQVLSPFSKFACFKMLRNAWNARKGLGSLKMLGNR